LLGFDFQLIALGNVLYKRLIPGKLSGHQKFTIRALNVVAISRSEVSEIDLH
jgi:hypothetical protein